MTSLEKSLKRLWLTYKVYHDVSSRDCPNSSDLATASMDNYLAYLESMSRESITDWRNDPSVIENQVRIILGFIELYDKPIKRDVITSKTRWCY